MPVPLLDRLTLEEKISLLAAVDWWRTPTIERDDVFIPHIKVSHHQYHQLQIGCSIALCA
jgi:hypothetical protein